MTELLIYLCCLHDEQQHVHVSSDATYISLYLSWFLISCKGRNGRKNCPSSGVHGVQSALKRWRLQNPIHQSGQWTQRLSANPSLEQKLSSKLYKENQWDGRKSSCSRKSPTERTQWNISRFPQTDPLDPLSPPADVHVWKTEFLWEEPLHVSLFKVHWINSLTSAVGNSRRRIKPEGVGKLDCHQLILLIGSREGQCHKGIQIWRKYDSSSESELGGVVVRFTTFLSTGTSPAALQNQL